MTLVEDAKDYLALWMPQGTTWKTATDAPGAVRLPTRAERFSRRMRTLEWVLGDFQWELDTLWVVPQCAAHAVSFGWSDGTFVGWYVNLQEPLRRNGSTLRTMDLMLDLVISPSGEWMWKDEDEVQTLVDDGVFDAELVHRLREEGEQVLRAHHEGAPPFDGGWESWRPDPAWQMPLLSDGWSNLN